MLLNFFAAYTPDAFGLFPRNATPTNIFPRLPRAYLDQIALLSERFFLPDGDGPLQIRAVE